MKGFPRRERIPFPPLLTICSYKNLLHFCDILPVPRRQQESLSRSPLSGIHPAAVSFSLMGISPPRSRPDTLESVSSFLPPVIATVGCCPPTVGFSSYGSPISRRRKCCTGSIGIQLSKISLAQPGHQKGLPDTPLCNACPIWSRRLFECLENSLHDSLFFCRQRLGYLFK